MITRQAVAAGDGATRRQLLRLGGLLTVSAAGAGLMTACGSGSGSGAAQSASSAGASGAGKFGGANMQLGWIKNVQFCGEYMASQRQYYHQQGLAVTLVSGGAAATSTEAAISTGKAWTGTSKPLAAAEARAKGAKVKIIAATMQDGGHVIVSPADKPIASPKDLIGRKVGVSAHTTPDFLALLKVNDIDPSKVKIVPVQFDPSPLVNGEVDAWDGYVNNEPVTLAQKGFKTHVFSYADFGLPTVAQVLEVAEGSLTKDRDKIKAFLTAEVRGWKDALAQPGRAVNLCVDDYGKDLNLSAANQAAVFRATMPLIQTDWTKKHGLLTLSAASMAATVKSIAATGTKTSPEDLFDLSILREIYADNPHLI